MISKEALEYLVKLGYEQDVLIETEQGLFSKTRLERVKFPKVETLQVSTLTSIVDYINSGTDDAPRTYLIQIVNPRRVKLLTELGPDYERNLIMQAEAMLPDNVTYDYFLDTERFNIMLQSGFADTKDKALLLKFTGLIRDEAVKETGDDGISQKVTIKTGVASVGEAEVPNPVTLAPYRTFPEIEQVESKFIFRMQEGPRAAIYEADGGAWRNEAMDKIKEYLEKELKGTSYSVQIIS